MGQRSNRDTEGVGLGSGVPLSSGEGLGLAKEGGERKWYRWVKWKWYKR